jgi:hypothetical protein
MGERHSHPFLKLSFANIGHDTNNPGNIPTTQWEVLLRYILIFYFIFLLQIVHLATYISIFPKITHFSELLVRSRVMFNKV